MTSEVLQLLQPDPFMDYIKAVFPHVDNDPNIIQLLDQLQHQPWGRSRVDQYAQHFSTITGLAAPGSAVLDLCCGADFRPDEGQFPPLLPMLLAHQGYHVHGIDLDPPPYWIHGYTHHQFDVFQGQWLHHFPPQSFDLVSCLGTLVRYDMSPRCIQSLENHPLHNNRNSDIEFFLGILSSRILKPNGYLLIQTKFEPVMYNLYQKISSQVTFQKTLKLDLRL